MWIAFHKSVLETKRNWRSLKRKIDYWIVYRRSCRWIEVIIKIIITIASTWRQLSSELKWEITIFLEVQSEFNFFKRHMLHAQRIVVPKWIETQRLLQ